MVADSGRPERGSLDPIWERAGLSRDSGAGGAVVSSDRAVVSALAVSRPAMSDPVATLPTLSLLLTLIEFISNLSASQ